MSAVVVGELLYGFRQGPRLQQSLAELRSFLDRPYVSFVPVGPVTADRYSRIMASLRARGRPIPTNDVWIAAHAMETGADLVLRGQPLRTHRPGRVGERRAGLRAARSHRGDDSMESMRNRVRGATSQGAGTAPPATPLGASRGDWSQGPRAGASRLSAASVAGATSTPPPYSSPGTTTVWRRTVSHPDRSPAASRSRCARDAAVLPRSSTTGSPSTSPGRWDPRRSGERSPWRTCTGSAARVTGARPGWTAGWRGSFRTARSTGEEPGGPGDSTAHGRACSSAPLGIVDAGRHAEPLEDVRTAA